MPCQPLESVLRHAASKSTVLSGLWMNVEERSLFVAKSTGAWQAFIRILYIPSGIYSTTTMMSAHPKHENCRLTPGDAGCRAQTFGHIRDFHRYGYLCRLLRMFSSEYGFVYSVRRKDSLIEIWIGSEAGSEFLSLDLDDPEPSKIDKTRHIIRRIINFSQ